MHEPANPYAPPQALDPPQRTAAGNLPFSRPYVSAQGKTFAAVAAAVAQIVCQLLLVGSLFMQIQLLSTAAEGAIDPAAAESNDKRHLAIAGVTIVSAIIALITLLVWVYHAHANLPALAAKHLDFSSGWAVGWFFVPIANLFKPYQVVMEIWNSSDPRPLQGLTVSSSVVVGSWWVMRVVSGLMERGVSSMSRHADTIDTIVGISWAALIVTLVLDIPMVLLQIRLLRTVQRFQDERYALIEQRPVPTGAANNPFAG